MQLSNLQKYCLDKMGIVRWQERKVDYAIFVQSDRALAADKKEMLSKIVQALQWPRDRVQIYVLPEPSLIMSKIEHAKPLKAVLFGFSVDLPMKTFLCLPTLAQLAADPKVKRDAWQRLQGLIGKD